MLLNWPFVSSRGSTAEEATWNVLNVQIPALVKLCEEGELSIDNIDVFCEKGVFDTDASRRILKAGSDAGWKINFHGDELHPMNSGEVSSASLHCVYVYNMYEPSSPDSQLTLSHNGMYTSL